MWRVKTETGGASPSATSSIGAVAVASLLNVRYRPVRDTMITSVGFLMTSLSSAVAALLIVLVAGGGSDTDAVVAGYSVFLVVSLFAATVRPVLVSRFGNPTPEGAFRVRAAELGGRAAMMGVIGAAGIAAMVPLMVPFFSGTIPANERHLLIGTLLLMSPAAYLVVRAAADSAVLAAANRFSTSAIIYAASALSMVGTTGGLLIAVGPIALAAGGLVGSLVLAAGHFVILRRHGLRLGEHPRLLFERQQWRLGGDLLMAGALPLAWQVQFAVALGFVSGEPGEITAYAYAYYLVGAFLVLPASAAMVTLPRLVAELEAGARRATVQHVAAITPSMLLVVVGLMSTSVAFGDPIASWLLDESMGEPAVDTLLTCLAALGGMAVANTVFLSVWPVAKELGRQRALALVAVGSVVLLVAAAALVRSDTATVAVVQSAVSLCSVVIGIYALLGRQGAELFVRLGARLGPTVVCAGIVAAVRLAAGEGTNPLEAAGLATGSLAAFVVLMALVWPGALMDVPVLSRLSRKRGSS